MQFLIGIRQASQVCRQISPEHTQIGLAAAIDLYGIVDGMSRIIILQVLFFPFYIVFQQTYLAKTFQHLRRTKLHTAHIYIDRPFDTTSAAFAHRIPILKRITD